MFGLDYFFYFRIIDETELELYLNGYYNNSNPVHAVISRGPIKGTFRKQLLIDHLREYILRGRNFTGLAYSFVESPIITEEEFTAVKDDVMADLLVNKYLVDKRWSETPILRLCRENELEIRPTPEYEHIVDCRCPSGYSHRLIINAKYGC